MGEPQAGNLNNPAMSRFKGYSRPIKYAPRPAPQLFSDISDQFMGVNQSGAEQTVTQAPVNPQPVQPVQSQQPAQAPQPIAPPRVVDMRPPQPVRPVPQNIESYAEPIPAPLSTQPLRVEKYVAPPVQVAEEAPMPVEMPQAFQLAPTPVTAQTAPIYYNNYNGEYEDVKGPKFDIKASLKRGIKSKNKKRGALVFAGGLASVVILAGIFVVFMNFNNKNGVAQAQASHAPVTYDSDIEPTNSQIAAYTVATTAPKYLVIPKLNVKSMITPIKLVNNSLGAPSNVFNTGWWQSSSAPGQPGTTILDGFTNDGVSNGVFATLSKLTPGSTFQVVMGNGQQINYEVDREVVLGTAGINMDQAITSLSTAGPGLNIITCTGQTLTCPTSGNGDFVVFSTEVNK